MATKSFCASSRIAHLSKIILDDGCHLIGATNLLNADPSAVHWRMVQAGNMARQKADKSPAFRTAYCKQAQLVVGFEHVALEMFELPVNTGSLML